LINDSVLFTKILHFRVNNIPPKKELINPNLGIQYMAKYAYINSFFLLLFLIQCIDIPNKNMTLPYSVPVNLHPKRKNLQKIKRVQTWK